MTEQGLHLSYGGETYGPYTAAEIRAWLADGSVPPDSLVHDGTDWRPAAEVLGPAPPPALRAAPPTLEEEAAARPRRDAPSPRPSRTVAVEPARRSGSILGPLLLLLLLAGLGAGGWYVLDLLHYFESEPTKAYRTFTQLAHSAKVGGGYEADVTTIRAAKAMMTAAFLKRVGGSTENDLADHLVWITPYSEFEVVREEVSPDGERATIEGRGHVYGWLDRMNAGAVAAAGSAVLVKEDGAWKVDSQSWTRTEPPGGSP